MAKAKGFDSNDWQKLSQLVEFTNLGEEKKDEE